MASIVELTTDADEDGSLVLHIRDEDGDTMRLAAIASGRGRYIADRQEDDRWHALLVTVDRDGSAESADMAEGDTFGVTGRDEYVVVRTDSAGSLRWKGHELDPEPCGGVVIREAP